MYRKSKQVINSENLTIDRHFQLDKSVQIFRYPCRPGYPVHSCFLWYFKAVDRAEEFERLSKVLV